MVCQMVYVQYKEDIYIQGFNVYIIVNVVDQQVVYLVVCKGVMDYDCCYGYCGLEEIIELFVNVEDCVLVIDDVMDDYFDNDDILVVVVVVVSFKQIDVVLCSGDKISIKGEVLCFVVVVLLEKVKKEICIVLGVLICVMQDVKQNWQVVQLLQVEVVLVLVVLQDGVICVLVGGFDFIQNNFNYVI